MALRLHSKTREIIEDVVKRCKPVTDKYYYGLILMDSTVVATIKNDLRLSAVPTGKNFKLRIKETSIWFSISSIRTWQSWS